MADENLRNRGRSPSGGIHPQPLYHNSGQVMGNEGASGGGNKVVTEV
jgi:hypothetical protein